MDEWGCEVDSDDDGVPDRIDRCPGTPPKVAVDERGCPVPQSAREIDRPWKAHRVLCVPFLLLEVILQPVWSCGRGEGAAWAQTAAEEDVPQLAAWLREPLDLRHADADELALLPWLDAGLGRAIVGLREAGGLHRMDDLLRIPGLDRERLEAIEPFVRLPGGVAWASRIDHREHLGPRGDLR